MYTWSHADATIWMQNIPNNQHKQLASQADDSDRNGGFFEIIEIGQFKLIRLSSTVKFSGILDNLVQRRGKSQTERNFYPFWS